jgi:hypothetical protein
LVRTFFTGQGGRVKERRSDADGAAILEALGWLRASREF